MHVSMYPQADCKLEADSNSYIISCIVKARPTASYRPKEQNICTVYI